MKSFHLRSLTPLFALFLGGGFAQAQELFPNFLTPSNRGSVGTEFSEWDSFASAYLDPNSPDVAAAASSPTLAQTLTDTAFLTGGMNIYSFSAATGYEISNDTSITIGTLGSVTLQLDTLGTLLDYSSIQLVYSGGTLAPTNLISESRLISGGYGGITNRVAVQWDLSGLNVSNYTITYQALGSSNSMNIAELDTATAYSEIVPSARNWNGGGGNDKWSTAANWAGDTVSSDGGNVTFGLAAGVAVDLDSNREVGLLTIGTNGDFAISPSNGARLTINTGITAALAGTGTTRISAPIYLGGHGLMNIGANATVELSGPISGAPAVSGYPAAGVYFDGLGKLILSGNNSFLGGVTVDGGGELIMAGVNQYSNATTVIAGSLVLRGDAPSGTAGTLGSATSAVVLGADPAVYGAKSEAALVVEGDYTVGRSISVTTGSNAKAIVARNTTAGAVVAGGVALASQATNVYLRAENGSDILKVTGAISGGSASQNLYKDGAGTVIFSGSSKTYASATTVSAGSLIVAAGNSVTGNGNWTVASGAEAQIDGMLGGTGSFALNGTLSGQGTINRTITTAGVGSLISSAGEAPGQLTLGSLNAASGASFVFDIGSSSDLIDVNGTFTGSLAAGGLAVTFTDAGDAQAGVLYTLFNYDSLSGLDASDFSIVSSQFVVSNWVISDGAVQVEFSAVPEPSGLALLAGAGMALAWWRERRR